MPHNNHIRQRRETINRQHPRQCRGDAASRCAHDDCVARRKIEDQFRDDAWVAAGDDADAWGARVVGEDLGVFCDTGKRAEGFGDGGVGGEEGLDGRGDGGHFEGYLEGSWTLVLMICAAYHEAGENEESIVGRSTFGGVTPTLSTSQNS